MCSTHAYSDSQLYTISEEEADDIMTDDELFAKLQPGYTELDLPDMVPMSEEPTVTSTMPKSQQLTVSPIGIESQSQPTQIDSQAKIISQPTQAGAHI